MSRQPSPERKRALKIWLASGRRKKPAQIAKELGLTPSLIRKWKCLDKWVAIPDKQRKGAPDGNKNALGNKGGPGGPKNNDHAVKHGLFRKILPDDPELLEIFDTTVDMSPLEMLWYQIRIAWMNIMRAQKIMFVKDKDDMTKEIKKTETYSDDNMTNEKQEWEIQFAWDKQGKVLTAQTSAMGRLTSMIKQYEEMLRTSPPDEVTHERRLRTDLLKAQIKVMTEKGW